MRKKSFFKMVLVAVAIVGGTTMSAKGNVENKNSFLASANTTSLNYVAKTEGTVVASTISRNNVQYEILEQPGKMMMCYAKGVFTMSYVNNAKSRIAFRLVDANGDIVYSDTSKKHMYHQRVNTDKLPVGEYTAVLFSADNYYERGFKVAE